MIFALEMPEILLHSHGQSKGCLRILIQGVTTTFIDLLIFLSILSIFIDFIDFIYLLPDVTSLEGCDVRGRAVVMNIHEG